jgi:hypothetical protein
MDPLKAMLPNIGGREDYYFDQNVYINSLLGNKLCDTSNKEKQMFKFGFDRSGIRVDINTEYYYNNFGYRSNDWAGNCPVLSVGCSNTFALGVPEEYSWPQVLSKMIDQDVRNLSRPGASIMDLVSKMFAYFKEFGNPETVFCLFPDPFRLRLPGNKKLISSKHLQDYIMNDIYLEKYSDNPISARPKYLKKPYDYEDVLPMELSVFLSSQAIHALEQYCNSNNIKLFWSSWHDSFSSVLNIIDTKVFDNFFYDQEMLIFGGEMDSECHSDHSQRNSKYFKIGLDNEDEARVAHPGIHKHLHIAESFYKQIGENK